VRISHYEVHDELARGGMGVVYRAVDSRSGARVVLKLLKVDSEKARRRLAREAEAMRRLTHPSVLSLYDAGEFQGAPYLVLPYVQGESLQDRLEREGPLHPDDVIPIAIQVGEGLQAAHQLGLLHRDVKPANVLVDQRLHGAVKLTDFGLVKDTSPAHEASVSLSLRGRFLGTPGYWPPEQAHGRLDELGPPADVYALGALTYALLSGHPPRSAETLIQALAAFEHPVESLPAPVPWWLDDLILRCLENEARDRPPLGQVLETLERRQPLRTAPAAAPSTPRPPRRQSAALLGAACGLLLSVGVGWSVVRAPSDPAESTAAVSSSTDSPPADPPVDEPELDPRASADAYARALEGDPDDTVALYSRASSLLDLGRIAEALADFERVVELDPLDLNAHCNVGTCKSRLGRDREALADFDRALQLNPTMQDAYAGRATSKARLGDLAGALTDYDRALELSPSDPISLANRALCKAQLGRHADALADYDLALELDPTRANVHLDRAASLVALGRDEQARADYEAVLRLDVNDHRAHYNLGICEERLGRAQQALAHYDRAVELAPNTMGYLHSRGGCLASLGRDLEAVVDFDRVLQLDPDQLAAHYSRGISLGSLGRHAEALESFNRALELDPQLTRGAICRGMTLARLGRHAEATADFERASAAADLTPDLAQMLQKFRLEAARLAQQAQRD